MVIRAFMNMAVKWLMSIKSSYHKQQSEVFISQRSRMIFLFKGNAGAIVVFLTNGLLALAQFL